MLKSVVKYSDFRDLFYGGGVGWGRSGKEIMELVGQWSHHSDEHVDPELKAAVLNLGDPSIMGIWDQFSVCFKT